MSVSEPQDHDDITRYDRVSSLQINDETKIEKCNMFEREREMRNMFTLEFYVSKKNKHSSFRIPGKYETPALSMGTL